MTTQTETTPQSQPCASASQPGDKKAPATELNSKPDVAASQPKSPLVTAKDAALPPASQPEPATDTAQPPASQPEPAKDAALPPASQPEPATDTAQPPASQPEPATDTAQPPASQPEPAADTALPPASQPEPATDAAQPPAPQPETTQPVGASQDTSASNTAHADTAQPTSGAIVSAPAAEKPVETYDITIIGGGPAALFAAFYAGLRKKKTKIIDALPELGGQLLLYPEKQIHDVGGFPAVLTKDFTRACIQQAMRDKPTVCLGEKTIGLEKVDNLWRVKTDKSNDHLTTTVILALGAGAGTPKKLPIEYNAAFEGQSIFYAVQDKSRFRDKRVLIAGGGDSAVDWAHEFVGFAKSVTLVHRSDKFRAVAGNVETLKTAGVDVKTFFEIKALSGKDQLEEAVLMDSRSKQEEKLSVDCVLVQFGFSLSLDFMEGWGLTLDNKRTIPVSRKMETNLPGVYACGDISTHEGKLKLIAVGFGEAATAVNFAATYIDPTSAAFPGHSTNMKV